MKESDFTSLEDYKVQAMVELTKDAKSYDRAIVKINYWEAINEGSFTIKRANLFDERNEELKRYCHTLRGEIFSMAYWAWPEGYQENQVNWNEAYEELNA